MIGTVSPVVEREGSDWTNKFDQNTILVSILKLKEHLGTVEDSIVEGQSHDHGHKTFGSHVVTWDIIARNGP